MKLSNTHHETIMRMITTAVLPRMEMGPCFDIYEFQTHKYEISKDTNMKFPNTQILHFQRHKYETFKHTNMKLSMRMITTAALPRLEMGPYLALTYINFKRTNMKFPNAQI